MQHIRGGNVFVLFLGDLGVFVGSLFLMLWIRSQGYSSEHILEDHLIPFLGLFCIWIIVFLIAGLYDTQVSLKRKSIPALLIKAQLINLFLAVMFFFLLPVGITPKTNLAIYLMISTVLLALWRLFIFPRIVIGMPLHALVIGNGKEARDLVHSLNDNPYFAFVTAELFDPTQHTDTESLREHLHTTIRTNNIRLLIGDLSDSRTEALIPFYYDLIYTNYSVQFVSLHQLYEDMHNRIPPSIIDKKWILENVHHGIRPVYGFLKRGIDIIGAVVLLLPCLLWFPLIALAIKLQDGGAVFYRSERVGQNNKRICIYKFRSMTGMDSGSTLDTKHVVTPLGQFLRKTQLDEFPQLLNVLKGDLSFVGPRPELPARAEVYAREIPYYNMRHLVKPGLSGWAQINHFDVPRGEVDVSRTVAKLSFDLFYLKRQSLLLDIEIALKTVKTMLVRTGT